MEKRESIIFWFILKLTVVNRQRRVVICYHFKGNFIIHCSLLTKMSSNRFPQSFLDLKFIITQECIAFTISKNVICKMYYMMNALNLPNQISGDSSQMCQTLFWWNTISFPLAYFSVFDQSLNNLVVYSSVWPRESTAQ